MLNLSSHGDSSNVFLTAEQVAKMFGCSSRTIQRSAIPTIKLGPRTIRYRLSDVNAWADAQSGRAA